MFNHRYRYFFILLLSLYTFVNTLLCEVYYYFKIDIEWYYALLTILSITFTSWEGNRLLESLISRKLPPEKNKIRYFAGFFAAGVIVSSATAVIIVLLVGGVLHNYSWQQNLNPLKLNLIYAILINL